MISRLQVLRGILVVAALLLSGLSHRAYAQCTSDNDGHEDPTTGSLDLTTASCYGDTEIVAHFGSSKGAYANALTFVSPTPTSSSGAICSDLNGGQSDCLFYTGSCSPAVSLSGCGADPNGNSGEISCWCKDPAKLAAPIRLPVVPNGHSESFATTLLSDTNVDGKHPDGSDKTWSSDPSKNMPVSDQLRTYKLSPDLYKFEWEDMYTGGTGDYNDYAGFLEARTCQKLPYPVSSVGDGAISCFVDCPSATGSCPAGTVTNSDLKFFVAIGFDTTSSESREARGRTIHISVASYANSAVAGRRFAVCPVLWFRSRNGAAPADDIQRVVYGKDSAKACQDNGDLSGEPRCFRLDAPLPNVYPISIAREQYYRSDSCGSPPSGGGDVFELPKSVVCGGYFGTHVEEYELALADVDAQLTSMDDQLGPSSLTELMDRLEYVNLEVMQDVAGDFHCPSGVNVSMHGVNFSVANHTEYGMQYTESPLVHDANLKLYERQ